MKEEVQRCQEAGAKALEGQKEPRVAPGEKHGWTPCITSISGAL